MLRSDPSLQPWQDCVCLLTDQYVSIQVPTSTFNATIEKMKNESVCVERKAKHTEETERENKMSHWIIGCGLERHPARPVEVVLLRIRQREVGTEFVAAKMEPRHRVLEESRSILFCESVRDTGSTLILENTDQVQIWWTDHFNPNQSKQRVSSPPSPVTTLPACWKKNKKHNLTIVELKLIPKLHWTPGATGHLGNSI